jgi:hypothetical protein
MQMLVQTFVELICLLVFVRLNVLKENRLPIVLTSLQLIIMCMLAILNQPIVIVDQAIIFVAVLLTTPIFFISPPTLVIVNELSIRGQITTKEIRRIVDFNSSANNDFQLFAIKSLIKNNRHTFLGKFLRLVILWLRND